MTSGTTIKEAINRIGTIATASDSAGGECEVWHSLQL